MATPADSASDSPASDAGGKDGTVTVLLVSGSTRGGSTNTALLRTAPGVAPAGVRVVMYDGLARLPAFNPDEEQALPTAAVDLRRRLGDADAVLFCTPEYAGTLPGSFKNLLDWTVGGGEMYGLPVGWVNVASPAAPTGGAGATSALAVVLGYVGADIVEPACLRAAVTRADVGPDGTVTDPAARRLLGQALQALAVRGRQRGAAAG